MHFVVTGLRETEGSRYRPRRGPIPANQPHRRLRRHLPM